MVPVEIIRAGLYEHFMRVTTRRAQHFVSENTDGTVLYVTDYTKGTTLYVTDYTEATTLYVSKDEGLCPSPFRKAMPWLLVQKRGEHKCRQLNVDAKNINKIPNHMHLM